MRTNLAISDAQFTDRKARAYREIQMRQERGEHHVSEVAHSYGDSLPVDDILERSGPCRYVVADTPLPLWRRILRRLR